jgi:hypothetical protein
MSYVENYVYGEEYVNRKEAFESDIQAIEDKYKAHFEFKKSSASHLNEYDKLNNHFVTMVNFPMVTFAWVENTDLPEYIKNECLDVFNKYFSEPIKSGSKE